MLNHSMEESSAEELIWTTSYGLIFRVDGDSLDLFLGGAKEPSKNVWCTVCGAASGLALCQGCGVDTYCSVEHQREDWPHHKDWSVVASSAELLELIFLTLTGARRIARSSSSARVDYGYPWRPEVSAFKA